MKNKKTLLILTLIALACIVLLCVSLIIVVVLYRRNQDFIQVPPIDNVSNGNQNPVSSPIETPIKNPNIRSYKIVDKKETEATTAYSIDNTIPQISGLSNKVTQDDFNQYVGDAVLRSDREVKFTDPNLESGKNTLELKYDIEYATDDFVSIMISGYQYSGGAHGFTVFIPINYDLKNNTRIELQDLFKTGADYLTKLSDYCIPRLKTKLGADADQKWIEDGAAAKAENYQLFTFSESGLKITFGDYQVAAYAVGPQNVTIPWSQLTTILNTKFANL